jgi:hypothetical protein
MIYAAKIAKQRMALGLRLNARCTTNGEGFSESDFEKRGTDENDQEDW